MFLMKTVGDPVNATQFHSKTFNRVSLEKMPLCDNTLLYIDDTTPAISIATLKFLSKPL